MELKCFAEYETWGPHEGCREFMDQPETWDCDGRVCAYIVFTIPEVEREWERYGPYTPQQIAESEGHLDYPTHLILACREHALECGEDDPFSKDTFVEFFTEGMTDGDAFECHESIYRGDKCTACGAEWVNVDPPGSPLPTNFGLAHRDGCLFTRYLDDHDSIVSEP